MEFVKSQRGADMLSYKNYQYWKHTSPFSDQYVLWRCRMRNRYNCRAIMKTNGTIIDSSRAIHTHPQSIVYDGSGDVKASDQDKVIKQRDWTMSDVRECLLPSGEILPINEYNHMVKKIVQPPGSSLPALKSQLAVHSLDSHHSDSKHNGTFREKNKNMIRIRQRSTSAKKNLTKRWELF
jgi:FLYWCH zinc finger domain